MDGLFEAAGGFFENVVSAAQTIFSEKEQTARVEAQQNAANTAAAALSANDLARFKTVALMVFGGALLFYLYKRA